MLKRFWKATGDQSLLSAERVMILAVAVILIVLVSLQYGAVRARNRDDERRIDLYNLQIAVQKFYALNGYYPTSLTSLSGLPASACQDPSVGGNCQNPAYGYIAFAAGTYPATNRAANCDNVKIKCAGYILFSKNMETVANPYSLASN